jgi:hypothetical protein
MSDVPHSGGSPGSGVRGAIPDAAKGAAASVIGDSDGDSDRDSLHILPLDWMPVTTPALRRARLIRNGRLQTMVELFGGVDMGSGQIAIEDVGKEFGWVRLSPHPDLVLLRKLAELPSYDVYSLRILLRDNGIAVGSMDALRLSPAKTAELTAYMTGFTRPLLAQIYGADQVSYQTFDDLIALFRSPDVQRAREKLTLMADRLGIDVTEIPRFLEDYGDIFMSVSYYRNCFDGLGPPTACFLDSLREIRENRQLKQDPDLMETCEAMQRSITGLMTRISSLFTQFEQSTNGMWDNLTADRFRELESTIRSYHTTIGGVLCALSVKINAWNRVFPERHLGGLMKRAEFVLLEMRQGFEIIHTMKDRVPLLAPGLGRPGSRPASPATPPAASS